MNTVTHSEAHALHAVAAAAAVAAASSTSTSAASEAITVPVVTPYKLHLIALSKLRPSNRNVRKSGGTAIPELAASIVRVGLLQNLTVIASADGESFEVVAGKRRLAALKLLAKRRKLDRNHPVPCLLVPDSSARTVSLTENVHRESMSPVDELFAWKALAAEGRALEDIAADFGVTPLVVKRRLKLANVSPRLLADYQADAVSLEQLMALAITDDHAAQEAAWYESPQWQRSPESLRDHLTHEEIDASRDAVARFVGVEAYEAAGGGIRRDLFSDEQSGAFLTDAGLLDALARDKLTAAAESAQLEGWGWVEVAPRATASELHAFQRARRTRREPSKAEAKRIAKLEAEQSKVQDKLDDEDADLSDDGVQALHEELDRLCNELEAIEQTLMVYAPGVVPISGAVVSVDHMGGVVVHRGLLREEQAKALRAQDRQEAGEATGSGADTEDAQPAKPGISEKTGEAPERASHCCVAGGGRPAPACGAGGRGASTGAPRHSRRLWQHAPQHHSVPAGPADAPCAGRGRGPGYRGHARGAGGLGGTPAQWPGRAVRRTAGDAAERAAVAAGRVRRLHRLSHRIAGERDSRCRAGAGRGPGHARLVDADCCRVLQSRVEGQDAGSGAGVRAG
ncbi:hypothetical protein AVME950_20700 [Acidovorax sp. SUPP950]|uniref:ParB/RepB/Spo0J family partition protein n=1 Tax=Acidovorax sp. SUPP950 TaxID=511901 RepID=UPI0023C79197|nr:ParB/RepB/Spo0J family partition protein [Acidovorax sp. SUPP950]GKS77358.1 hypothetical protein AVME950_20700 [Acidovorax sp. SUPP950]